MRLIVKRGDTLINELRFSRGPIYIGRQAGSQVFLPDKAVSRLHSVIYAAKDGTWVVEDLDSANKTYLNNDPVHRAGIKTGDVIKIGDFVIEVNFDTLGPEEKPINLEDTVTHGPAISGGQQTIIRRPEAEDAPHIRMAAKRIKDFAFAIRVINSVSSPDKFVSEFVALLLKQFSGFCAWTALRKDIAGSFVWYGGKKRSGEAVELKDILLNDMITHAIERQEYTLLPRVTKQSETEQMRSAMIVPIMGEKGCHGCIYVANTVEHEHYSIGELDYLIMLSLVVESWLNRINGK